MNRNKTAILMIAILVMSAIVPIVSAQMPVTIKGKVTFEDGTGVGKWWLVNVTNLDTGVLLGSKDTTIGSDYFVPTNPSNLTVGDTIEAITKNGSWSGRATHVVQSGENVAGVFILMNITVSTNTPPNATVETPSGKQCGDIAINYTLFDADSDTCSIEVEFKGGLHTTWTSATVSGQTTGLTSSPSGVLHSITWLSTVDIPGEDSLFQIRITPSDSEATGEAGTTSDFEVDNKAPTIVFIQPTPDDGEEVTENYVVINVSITDDDVVDTVWLDWNETIVPSGPGSVGSESGNPVLFATGNVTEGSSTEYIYTFNVTNLTNGEYTYKVFANDTTTCRNLGVSETRNVIINVTAETFELPLVAGWNLISIPMEIADTSINAVFPDASNGDMIYAYDSGIWDISTYYSEFSTWDGDVMTIQPDRGYWYIANSEYTATITGTEAGPRSVPIATGWNLIGYTRLSEAVLNDLITEEDGCSGGDMIYAYDSGVWDISTYYSEFSTWDGDVTVMQPGRGYWYVANAPFTWEY